jgi:SnoaL-like polyketide cyclase/MerR family regulatory protein
MRIGELAGLVGISTRAIRHYHHVGLLPEPARTGPGGNPGPARPAAAAGRGRRQALQTGTRLRRADRVVQANIEDIVAAQDKVAVRVRFRGTHRGEFLGIPATGRTIEYVSHEFYRIAGGLIAEEWICSDMATLLGQITGPSGT